MMNIDRISHCFWYDCWTLL